MTWVKVLRRRARGAGARRAGAAALVAVIGLLGGRAPAGAAQLSSGAEPAGRGAGSVAMLAWPPCDEPRTPPSSPRGFTAAVAGASFFTADDGIHGRELWRSDGTRAGTVLVKDIRPGANPSNPSSLTLVRGTVFFTADNGVHGRELWKSDGTRAGTVLVKNIRPAAGASNPTSLTAVRGTLFFDADDGTHGAELWKSDGTRAGTVLVKDVYPGATSSHTKPYGYTRVMSRAGGTLFFSADDGAHGLELWRSDGTTAGTALVKDIEPGGGDSYNFSREMTAVGRELFFSATDTTHGEELWKTDGTQAGTVLFIDLADDYYDSDPTNLTNVAGTLFFNLGGGSHDHGAEHLWKTDGTAAGTVLVERMDSYAYPGNLTDVGGTLFFRAFDFTHGSKLWKSNGTAVGTAVVKDIRPGDDYFADGSAPTNLTRMTGRLFFSADDGVRGRELWRSDGTRAGTVLIKDVRPGAGSSKPSSLTDVGGTLFFSASDATHGAELWTSDGTRAGTVLVKDINAGRLC